ncbi:MAG: glycosyltransferase family 2 protein, partial [Gammaproteobacteria bacterium]
ALLARQSERNADIVVGNRVKEGMGRSDSRSGMLAGEDAFWKPNGMPELMSTANVPIRVALLKRMLAFSPAFDIRFSPMGGEDADFFMRARKLGARFAGARDSMVQFRTEGARATLAGRVMRKFKAGCAQAHLARRHLSLYRMSRWLLMLIARTLAELIAAPARVPFFSLRADCLSKLGAACGMWYGVLGGRVRYYTGQGLSE